MLKIKHLLTCASVLFDTKSGKYIEWFEDSKPDEGTTTDYTFNAGGSILFTLNSEDEVVPTDDPKEFIINEDTFVRPFYEVDVGDMVHAMVDENNLATTEYVEQLHKQLQDIINEAFNY